MKLSIISPVYKAEAIVDELVRRIVLATTNITDDYEVILVEDGGPDNSWDKIQENCKNNTKVKGIKLSRNFGQHYAISAGLDYATGDYIILLDCDLQDDPEDFIKLIEKAKEGFDVVFTRRLNRRHSYFKMALSWLYKKMFGLFSERKYSFENGSLFLISKDVVNAIKKLKESHRQIAQLIRWVGFDHTYVEVEHHERFEGKSSYTLTKLFSMVFEGWIANSDKLLKYSIYTGMLFSSISFIMGICILLLYFFRGFAIGWPSIILSILFSTGLMLMSIGVLGLYIGKIFEQSKNRPLYIVQKILNLNE